VVTRPGPPRRDQEGHDRGLVAGCAWLVGTESLFLREVDRGASVLLERGVAAPAIRSDISADDVLRTIVGMIYAQGGGDWQAMALRLVDVFVDGLRVHKMSRRDLSHAGRPLVTAKDGLPR
jgi:hypothetical protein